MFFSKKCVNVAAMMFRSLDANSILGCAPSSIMKTAPCGWGPVGDGGRKLNYKKEERKTNVCMSQVKLHEDLDEAGNDDDDE